MQNNVLQFPYTSLEQEEHVARVTTVRDKAWRSHMMCWKLRRRVAVIESYSIDKEFEHSEWKDDLIPVLDKMKEELAGLEEEHRDNLTEVPPGERHHYEI